MKKTFILFLLFTLAFSICLYAEKKITIARRMRILIVDIDSQAPETSILSGKTIAEELEKSILDSQAILEKIIPLKRKDYKNLSGLKLENMLGIIKKGQDLNVEALIAGKVTKNEKELYDIQIQLIDVQKKDIPSTRRVLNFAEVKDVEETAESLDAKVKDLITALEKGTFPRVDIITPNFDIVSIIQINRDNFPEIKLSVSVVNKKGDPVSVPPDLFEIRENGNMVLADIQKVKAKGKAYVPITILLVIDRSPSMLEELDGTKTGKPFKRAKLATLEFINKLSPKDKIKIVAFDYEVLSLGEYTEDKNYYTEKLNKLKVGKGTGLYNALKYAANDMIKIEGEKVVIFLTDGKNDVRRARKEVKRVTLEDGLKIAKKYTIPVYTIGFGGADEKVLNRIAKETHSIFFKAASSEKLKELYLKIHKIIENQYIVSYQSLADKSGKVRVSLNIKDDEREFTLSEDEQEKALDYKKDRILKKESEKIELKKKEVESDRQYVKEEKKKLEQDIKDIETKKKNIESEKNELEKEKEKLAGLKSELSEKEKQTSDQKNELDLKQKELDKKETKLSTETRELENRKKKIQDEEAQLDVKEKQLTAKEKQLKNRETKLKQEEITLEKKKKLIIEIEKNIRNTNKEILDFLKKKMEYINIEKEKLDTLESTAKDQ